MLIKQDKLLHFLASYFIATLIGWWAVIPAIGKEVYDLYIKKSKFSVADLVADAAGIAVAMGVFGLTAIGG